MGVRQLGDPVQGVRPARGAPRPVREARRRRARCSRITGVAPSVALHIPWDAVDDYARAGQARRRARGAGRGHQRQRVPGRRLQAGQRLPPRPGGARQGPRAPAGLRRHHGRDRVPRPQAVVRRRHQLPGPGLDRRPPGPAGRGAGASTYERLGADQRLLLEYKLFEPAFYHTDVPDWGTAYAHCLRARATRPRWWSTPATTRPGTNIEFIVAFLLREREAGRVRLQQPLLRRRRPDGRGGRPVPAVPDHARGRPGRRLRAGGRDRVHARPVPQHRAQDPRR